MGEIGRRAAGVLLAAAAMTGLAAGVAVARSGGSDAGSGTAGFDRGARTRLIQTQTPQPEDGTGRKLCPNRQGDGNGDGSSPQATPSDTSV